MKKFKSGFTLAEVLITLAIIGVVAAIVMPSVMSNYQFKSVGVKLGKFMSTVEAATRPFVVNNGNFADDTTGVERDEQGNITNPGESTVEFFLNESFMFKTFNTGSTTASALEYPNPQTSLYTAYSTAVDEAGAPSGLQPIATLKDGTSIQVFFDNTPYQDDHRDLVPVEKYGAPVFRFSFNPAVQGLPNTAQRFFQFTVTELGYLFPHENDDCLWALYNNNFETNSRSFDDDSVCHHETTAGNTGA